MHTSFRRLRDCKLYKAFWDSGVLREVDLPGFGKLESAILVRYIRGENLWVDDLESGTPISRHYGNFVHVIRNYLPVGPWQDVEEDLMCLALFLDARWQVNSPLREPPGTPDADWFTRGYSGVANPLFRANMNLSGGELQRMERIMRLPSISHVYIGKEARKIGNEGYVPEAALANAPGKTNVETFLYILGRYEDREVAITQSPLSLSTDGISLIFRPDIGKFIMAEEKIKNRITIINGEVWATPAFRAWRILNQGATVKTNGMTKYFELSENSDLEVSSTTLRNLPLADDAWFEERDLEDEVRDFIRA